MNVFVFCKKLLEIEHILPEGYRDNDSVYTINVNRGKIITLDIFLYGIDFELIHNLPYKIVILSINGDKISITEEELYDLSTVCLSYPHQQNFPVLDLVSKRLVNDGVFLS